MSVRHLQLQTFGQILAVRLNSSFCKRRRVSLEAGNIPFFDENLKEEKVQIFVGRLQGEVIDVKISTKGDVQ